jgi:hypothetical protein
VGQVLIQTLEQSFNINMPLSCNWLTKSKSSLEFYSLDIQTMLPGVSISAETAHIPLGQEDTLKSFDLDDISWTTQSALAVLSSPVMVTGSLAVTGIVFLVPKLLFMGGVVVASNLS